MINYTVTLTEAENKALNYIAISAEEWIVTAAKERARIAIEEIVAQEVQRKLEAGEPIVGSKEDIVLAADIKLAAERNEESLAALLALSGQ